MTWILLAVLAGSLSLATNANAQIQADRLFPTGVEIGKTAEIKVEGKFPQWPPIIHCDREDVMISAKDDAGQLMIKVDRDASPGVAWIRLRDDKSVTKLLPLFLEPVKVTLEAEPNNKIDDAAMLVLPTVVSARLHKSRELDGYKVRLEAGKTLVAQLIADRVLGSPMDAILQLVDERGNIIAQTDDDAGLDPLLVHHAVTDGPAVVRVFAFPKTPNSTIGYAGGSDYVYHLRLTSGKYLDHALPHLATLVAKSPEIGGWNLDDKETPVVARADGLSPELVFLPDGLGWQWRRAIDSSAEWNHESISPHEDSIVVAKLPTIATGRFAAPGQEDRLRFTAEKGKRYRISVSARSVGLPTDTLIRVLRVKDQVELVRNDDESKGEADSSVLFVAKEDGTVDVLISELVDGYGARHAYTLRVTEAESTYRLTLPFDHVTVQPGKEASIAVTVDRLDGFNSKIQVSAQGLPDGIESEAVVSEQKGKTANAVTLKLKAKQETRWQGKVILVGQVETGEGAFNAEPVNAVFHPCPEVDVTEIWITVPEP